MVDGLETLLDLVDRGVAVKVLEGLVAGEHTGDSELLADIRELRQLRRELQSSRIRAGIQTAREHGDHAPIATRRSARLGCGEIEASRCAASPEALACRSEPPTACWHDKDLVRARYPLGRELSR